MSDALSLLEASISDVGYWTGWCDDASQSTFRVDFGGVQLRNRRDVGDNTPSGNVSLLFREPRLVHFFSHGGAGSEHWTAWLPRFQCGELPPLRVWKPLTLSDPNVSRTIVAGNAASVGTMIGETNEPQPQPGEAMLAMWCMGSTMMGGLHPYNRYEFGKGWGPLGIVVAARGMDITLDGLLLEPAEIRTRSETWWNYRKEYWARIGTGDRYPTEFACDVTIPHSGGVNAKIEVYCTEDANPP